MKLRYSLRVKLTILFLCTIVLPILLIVFVLPTYYRNLLTDETQTLTEGLLASLTRNVETYLDDLDRLTISPYLSDEVMRALKLKVSGQYAQANEYTKLLANRALNTTLPSFFQNPRKDIVATILLPLDGSIFVSSRESDNMPTVPGYAFADQAWYRQAVEAKGQVAFISVHPQDYFPESERKQVFSVARLIRDPDSWQPLAVMMADADTVVLSQIASDLKFNVSAIFCIVDGNHQVLFSTRPISDRLLSQIGQDRPLLDDTQDSYVRVSKTISPTQWTAVVLLSSSEINAKVRWLYVVGLLFAVVGLILTFGLFYTLSQSIVSPFQQMMAVMQNVQRGDLQARFANRGQDEIEELGNALNNMICQLGELIDREYKARLNQRNAEYLALQSQIQPHFLYNTLNSFIALNRLGERSALEKSIYALSNMLRYTLGDGEWTTVEDELHFLQRYSDLQQLRFQERLVTDISFEPDVFQVRIPKLLLQPLVENAIIHGIEPLTKPCRLVVKAQRQQARLSISVCDDGAGFDAEQPAAGTGIGLSNVRERLQKAYPLSSFLITSQPGAGTQIRIEIPLSPAEADGEHANESADRR